MKSFSVSERGSPAATEMDPALIGEAMQQTGVFRIDGSSSHWGGRFAAHSSQVVPNVWHAFKQQSRIIAHFRMHQNRALQSKRRLGTIRTMDGSAISLARSTRQSIMSYLDGEQPLECVLSVIASGSEGDGLREFILELKGYGDPVRHDQLLARLAD